ENGTGWELITVNRRFFSVAVALALVLTALACGLYLRSGKPAGAAGGSASVVASVDDDVSVTLATNLSPSVPVGLPYQVQTSLTIVNGNTAADVAVSASLLAPTICHPRLLSDDDGTDSDGSLKSPDILTGPTILGAQQMTRLDWTAMAMAANETRTVSRYYEVNCPAGGPYCPQIVANVSTSYTD